MRKIISEGGIRNIGELSDRYKKAKILHPNNKKYYILKDITVLIYIYVATQPIKTF